jgi:SAM-dependent methyltransferase
MQLDASPEPSYDDYNAIEEAFGRFLDESLGPRGPDSLFDVLGAAGLPAHGLALDVGCGEGRDAIELVRRFGLHVLGVDPEQRQIDSATALAAAAGLTDAVEFRPGSAEAVPVPDASVDLVWCKEVLTFTDLTAAFGEFRRALRSNGVGLVYQVLTGPKMSDEEARQFWEVELGYGRAHSVRPADVESAIASVGLEVTRRIDFGSEWGEFAQERTNAGGRRLVHAARLLRDPQRYVERFGQAPYRVMLGDCLWHVYRMIGKLHSTAFLFSKPE